MSWTLTEEEFKARVAAYVREGNITEQSTHSKLPANWEGMSLDALWNALNDPQRFEMQRREPKRQEKNPPSEAAE
jgi:hypothetical protein